MQETSIENYARKTANKLALRLMEWTRPLKNTAS
jgi:hypothetical protein